MTSKLQHKSSVITIGQPWFEQLGFRHSPFSAKVIDKSTTLVGYEDAVQSAWQLIQQRKLLVVQGKYGNGKTTFVKHLLSLLKGKRKTIYFAANRLHEDLDIDALIQGRYGTLGKVFNIMSTDMVLVLDEAHYLKQRDVRQVYDRYLSGHLKSIVFISSEKSRIALPSRVDKAINGHIIQLGGLSEESARLLVRQRLGEKLPQIDERVIAMIYEKSNASVREFLINCDKVARFIVSRNRKRITTKDLDTILSSS